MEKTEIAESQAGGDAPRRQPVRAARADRPDPGDRRDDRPADADRADPARYRRLRRDGRARVVGDGLSPGRDRLRVHELQPLLGWPQRPPDVRDVGAATIPFGVGHSERLLTMMAGIARPGRHLGDAVVRRPARRGGRRARHRSALGRAAVAATSRARPGSRCRAIASGSRRPGGWSPATSTGPASSASTPASATSETASTSAARVRDRRADRSRQRRRPAVRGRPAGRGRLHLDPARGVPAPADALARPDAGLHRAVPLRADGFRFRILGRSDDMFIVKGVNVFPLSIQAVLCGSRRGSPASSRSSSTVRHRSTTRCRSRSRSRATCPSSGTTSSRGRSQRDSRRSSTSRPPCSPVRPSGVTTEGKTRRVVRSYRGEVD